MAKYIFFFVMILVNIAIVGYSATALKKIIKKELTFVKRALIANGILLILFIAIGFFEFAGYLVPRPPYDNVYIPYYFVPGLEIYYIIMNCCREYVFKLYRTFTSHHTASIITIIYFPGLLGLILGSIKWYILGLIWERFKKWKKTKERQKN